MVGALAYAHQPPGDTDPSQAAEAAARPNTASVEYAVPTSCDFVPPADAMAVGRSGGTVAVAQAPYPSALDDGTAAHDVTLKYPSVRTSFCVDWQQYSSTQLATAAYPAHGAVLAISIRGNCNTSPAQP